MNDTPHPDFPSDEIPGADEHQSYEADRVADYPRQAQRTLRIRRATVALVLHGTRGDVLGYNDALTDLALTEHATMAEIARPLFWALSHLPAGAEEPTELVGLLTRLYGIPDDPERGPR
ncbi:hypothetical protein [Gordonia sp. NPDC003429]